MAIKQRKAGQFTVLDLEGDFRGGEENFSELRAAGFAAIGEQSCVALNCRRVSFLDSSTLGLLVQLLQSAEANGLNLVLTGVTDRVSRWFELSGLDRLFTIYSGDQEPADLGNAPGHKLPRRAVDSVDVETMVSELQQALGEADDQGAPSSPDPVDPQMFGEIRKLLSSLEEETN